MPFLGKLIAQADKNPRRIGMSLFRGMSENLGQEMVKSIDMFVAVSTKCLNDPSSLVRAEAFRGMEGISNYLDTKHQITQFMKLVPIAVKSAKEILAKSSDDEDAAPGFEMFNTLAESPVPVRRGRVVWN